MWGPSGPLKRAGYLEEDVPRTLHKPNMLFVILSPLGLSNLNILDMYGQTPTCPPELLGPFQRNPVRALFIYM